MRRPKISDWLSGKAVPRVAQAAAGVSARTPAVFTEPAVVEAFGKRTTTTGIVDRGANDYNIAQMLLALRGNYPGQPSDNRFQEATSGFMGANYLAVHRHSEMVQMSRPRARVRHPADPRGFIDLPAEDEFVQLIERPNPRETWGQFAYQIMQQMKLTGSAKVWKVPNAFGRTCEMYCLRTATMWPLPQAIPQYPRGAWRVQPLYPYGPFSFMPTANTAVGALLPAEQVMQIMYSHPVLTYDGYSPFTAMRTQTDTVNAIDQGRLARMLQGTDPTSIVEFDAEVENPSPADLDRMRAQMEQVHVGPNNTGKVWFAMPGTKIHEYGTAPNNMLWQEGWNQLSSFIFAGVGITKPVAGMIDETSYATLFAAIKQYFLLFLKPDLHRISSIFSLMLAPEFNKDYFLHIDCPKVDDDSIIQNQITNAVTAKTMLKNEARILCELPPWTKEQGGEDVVGDPSPYEKEQLEKQEQQAAQQGAGLPGAPGEPNPNEQNIPDMSEPGQTSNGQPPESEAGRPINRLGSGGLGSKPPRQAAASGGRMVGALRQRQAKRAKPDFKKYAKDFLSQRNGVA